jgi:hypothetical protein
MNKSSIGLLVVFCCWMAVACKKDDPEPVDTTPTTAQNKGDFKYSLNGGAVLAADSAKYYSQNTTIFAFKNNANISFEINLSDLSVGTYSISSSTGNQFQYTVGSANYNGTGNVNITANANNQLSGNFNCALSGGTLTSVTGTFVDLPRK